MSEPAKEKSKKKPIIIGIVIFVVLAMIFGSSGIETIKLESDLVFLTELGEEEVIEYSFEPTGADDSGIELISEDEAVISVEDNKVIAVSEGETYIYVQTSDGSVKSNKVKAVVELKKDETDKMEDIADKETEKEEQSAEKDDLADDSQGADAKANETQTEDKASQPTSAPATVTEAKNNVQTPASAPANDTAPSTSSEAKPAADYSQPTTTQSTQDYTVYITDTGTKYHGGGCRMLKKSKIPTTLSKAKSMGYEACGICH